VSKIINLALPYQARTPKPWIAFMEEFFGADHYFVHFNRQPGVADAFLDQNTPRFLRNLYRKNVLTTPPAPGMMMINLAQTKAPLGEPVLSDEELAVYVAAFEETGFTSSINWYRNMDRNWQILADVSPVIHQPALMIYGEQDMIPKSENLVEFVPNVDVISLDCGHWIQQEMPKDTTRAILDWMTRQEAMSIAG
jgi:pimeloyl-ACP methyl ester carboxylesterase